MEAAGFSHQNWCSPDSTRLRAGRGPNPSGSWATSTAIAAPISSASGVDSAISNGNGTFAAATFILAEMGYNNGWRIENHPRFAADLTGDGKADLVGFGDDGVWVSVTGGSGAKLVLAGFCYNQGWRVPLHPRYLADLTGDRKADIVGFGDAGVRADLGNGHGRFTPASFALRDFGY